MLLWSSKPRAGPEAQDNPPRHAPAVQNTIKPLRPLPLASAGRAEEPIPAALVEASPEGSGADTDVPSHGLDMRSKTTLVSFLSREKNSLLFGATRTGLLVAQGTLSIEGAKSNPANFVLAIFKLQKLSELS